MVKCLCIGATVLMTGCAEEDIKARLGKVQAAFCNLRSIWRCSQLSVNAKLRIFKSSVVAVLLYGCRVLRMVKIKVTKRS